MHFFKDLIKKKILFNFVIIDGEIYFHITPLFRAWRKICFARSEKIITTKSVYDFLKTQPGYKNSMVLKQIRGKYYRCVIFDLKTAPIELLQLMSNMDSKWLKARG